MYIASDTEDSIKLTLTLHSKGLTARDFEGVFTKIYDQNYS